MDINVMKDTAKLVGSIVIGKGITNVVNKSLGWTIGECVKPLDKFSTAAGVAAISWATSKTICNMVDEAIDRAADIVIQIQDKWEEAKTAYEEDPDAVSENMRKKTADAIEKFVYGDKPDTWSDEYIKEHFGEDSYVWWLKHHNAEEEKEEL